MFVRNGVAGKTALDIQSHAGCTVSLAFAVIYPLATETASLACIAGVLLELTGVEPSGAALDRLWNQIACLKMLQSPEGKIVTIDVGQGQVEVMVILYRLEVEVSPQGDGFVS